MRQHLIRAEWQQANPRVQEEILWWLHDKGYKHINVGTCVELLLDCSQNLHKDFSILDDTSVDITTFYDYVLQNEESIVAWQGKELIEILWYEIIKNIQKLLANGKTLKEKLAQ